MKIKYILLLLTGMLASTGFKQAAAQKAELPFSVSYPQPLIVTGNEHLEKYDYTEYAAGDDIIQLKHYHNLSVLKAKKLMEDRKYFVLAMFKDQPNPYPGMLSNSIGCPEELQPKPKEDTLTMRLSFKLFATSNLIYGNCNINDNYYQCAYMLFYCAAKSDFFELKIYTPKKSPSFNYDSLISSIHCN